EVFLTNRLVAGAGFEPTSFVDTKSEPEANMLLLLVLLLSI
ncbi:MAG: hypothetical protein ACJA13_002391, partial [Paraglaciecola sp.]